MCIDAVRTGYISAVRDLPRGLDGRGACEARNSLHHTILLRKIVNEVLGRVLSRGM